MLEDTPRSGMLPLSENSSAGSAENDRRDRVSEPRTLIGGALVGVGPFLLPVGGGAPIIRA
jgi:hypothetical protein